MAKTRKNRKGKRSKRNKYIMKGCSRKRSRMLGGSFYKPASPVPAPLVGQPWTYDKWPGSGGITGSHNEPLVIGPSVIVGRKGTVGSLYWEDFPFFPIDTVFYVKPKVPLTYCFYQLNILGLEGMNTDGAVPGLNRNNVYRLPVIVPENSLSDRFNSIVLPLRKKIHTNLTHAKALVSLRDTLLPRLISGQLRIPEAEALIEETSA